MRGLNRHLGWALVALLLAPTGASAGEVRISIDRLEVPPGQPDQASLQQAADDAQGHLQSEASNVLRENERPLCSAGALEGAPCFLVDRWDFALGNAPPDEVLPLLSGQPYHFAALVHGRSSRAEDGATVRVRARVATHPDRLLHIEFDYRAEAWLEFRRLFRAALLYSVARAEVTVGGVDPAATTALLGKAQGELNDFARFDAACAEGVQAGTAPVVVPPASEVEALPGDPEGTGPAGTAPEGAAPVVVPQAPEPPAPFGGAEVIGLGALCEEIAGGLAEIDAILREREAS